ncbi:MAG: hypothetical protein WD772_11785, partial [Pseudohongiellaceae bacterium]
ATEFTARYFYGAGVSFAGEMHNDQWTVYGAYNPLRPLYKFQVEDHDNSEFYISSRSGELIQLTTSEQRLWGYLGAVIHWLYPTLLRQHTAVWSQVVIWLTILGIFLTATGLYIGIKQFRRRQSGRLSPYTGINLYHHYFGLVFGILTLSWVFSGLFSMNPWGALEGEGAALETERLQGRNLVWDEIDQLITALAAREDLAQNLRLEIFVQAGEPVVISYGEDAERIRLDWQTLQPERLTEDRLSQLAKRIQPGQEIAAAGLISEPDAYYYSHHVVREFPVYRVIMDDPQQHRYYLSPVTGQLIHKVDQELRWYRWLFYGVHRGDFTVWSRSRPLWDLFMLIFLGGVTLVCGSGCYMALRRLRIDLSLKVGSSGLPVEDIALKPE